MSTSSLQNDPETGRARQEGSVLVTSPRMTGTRLAGNGTRLAGNRAPLSAGVWAETPAALPAPSVPSAPTVPGTRFLRGPLERRSSGSRVRELAYLGSKRLLDMVGAALGLLFLSPVLAAAAIWIKLGSPGPVLFRQERIGKGQRPFTMLKFRTMVLNAEAQRDDLEDQNEVDGPVFKIKDDPRITRSGRFLRRYSIDELPQLLNVLRGDMSLVGPRPPLRHEVEDYESWMLERLSVIPGLTCTWQVSGRSQLSFVEWMEMDIDYVRRRSLLRDCGLILKTVPAVIRGDGAY